MTGFHLKPNVSTRKFNQILSRFQAQLEDGSIQPNAELMRLSVIEGNVFSDEQWDMLAPDGWYGRATKPDDDDEAEFTIIVAGEEITSIYDEETECFYTIEDEPRIFSPEDVDEIKWEKDHFLIKRTLLFPRIE